MAKIAVVGDGPGGLSAALFLARGGHAVTVFGDGQSAMHYAYLNNYLGAPSTSGTDLQATGRHQAEAAGANIDLRRVAAVTADLQLTLSDGDGDSADYLILCEGRDHPIADSLGVGLTESGAIVVDRDQRTSLERVYAVGRSTRPTRSQAIISAGDGATAALDILAIEAGSDVQDWDSPPE